MYQLVLMDIRISVYTGLSNCLKGLSIEKEEIWSWADDPRNSFRNSLSVLFCHLWEFDTDVDIEVDEQLIQDKANTQGDQIIYCRKQWNTDDETVVVFCH